jgi:hypothetical protein
MGRTVGSKSNVNAFSVVSSDSFGRSSNRNAIKVPVVMDIDCGLLPLSVYGIARGAALF